MKLLPIIIALLAAVAAGCSSSGDAAAESGADSLDVAMPAAPAHATDSAIYALGYEGGRQMLDECIDLNQIEVRLLDTRARIHLIATRVDAEAADDYQRGFLDAIRHNCDSLAHILNIK